MRPQRREVVAGGGGPADQGFGGGAAKLERYGEAFLEVIEAHLEAAAS